MHVVFVEPCCPANQREFLRGLLSTGARVSAISERPAEALPSELREGLSLVASRCRGSRGRGAETRARGDRGAM